MGVNGLQSYVDERPSLFATSTVISASTNERPLLVVDGDGFYRFLYRTSFGERQAQALDTLTGGDYGRFETAVQSWLDQLRLLAEITVYLDGLHEDSKSETHCLRRGSEVLQSRRSFDRLYGSGRACKVAVTASDVTEMTFPVFPTLLKEAFIHTLRRCGITVVQANGDADFEMARTARERGAMAVLAQDSDFLLHPACPGYIPFSSIDLRDGTMRALLYRPEETAGGFRFSNASYLPVLAVLLGTDHFDASTQLAGFHRAIGLAASKSAWQRIETVAGWLRRLRLGEGYRGLRDALQSQRGSAKLWGKIQIALSRYQLEEQATVPRLLADAAYREALLSRDVADIVIGGQFRFPATLGRANCTLGRAMLRAIAARLYSLASVLSEDSAALERVAEFDVNSSELYASRTVKLDALTGVPTQPYAHRALVWALCGVIPPEDVTIGGSLEGFRAVVAWACWVGLSEELEPWECAVITRMFCARPQAPSSLDSLLIHRRAVEIDGAVQMVCRMALLLHGLCGRCFAVESVPIGELWNGLAFHVAYADAVNSGSADAASASDRLKVPSWLCDPLVQDMQDLTLV